MNLAILHLPMIECEHGLGSLTRQACGRRWQIAHMPSAAARPNAIDARDIRESPCGRCLVGKARAEPVSIPWPPPKPKGRRKRMEQPIEPKPEANPKPDESTFIKTMQQLPTSKLTIEELMDKDKGKVKELLEKQPDADQLVERRTLHTLRIELTDEELALLIQSHQADQTPAHRTDNLAVWARKVLLDLPRI